MISKNKTKYIRSLEQRKMRRAEGVFLAEGPKLTGELLPYFHCLYLAATEDWLKDNPHAQADEVTEASADEIAKASLLKAPQNVLAIFKQRDENASPAVTRSKLCLALDGVQDPGNLGTILRIADWFGIEDVFCSTTTADVYSPKAVQATMGAIARVHTHYVELPDFIRSLGNDIPVYGTFLDGRNIYREELTPSGLIIMGNEGNGISPDVAQTVNRRLYIPNYPEGRTTTESLNVATATAIVCAEFRRRG